MTFDGSFGAALIEAAHRHPDRQALWASGGHLSYRELFDEGARIATALHEAGIGPGDMVAVLSHRTVNAYASALGVLLAGCTYVPLNTTYSADRNGQIVQAVEARALVLDNRCASKLDTYVSDLDAGAVILLPEAGAALVEDRRCVLASDMKAADFEAYRVPHLDREALAYIMFTSGTTGKPKGVPITHANVDAYFTGVSQVTPHTAEDKILQFVDLTFDVSIHDMGLAWLNGGELITVPDGTRELAPRLIVKHGVTSCMLAPSAVAAFRRFDTLLPSLRLSLFCGEALPVLTAASWLKVAPNSQLFNIYGPTEGTILISAHHFDPVADAELDMVPIGRPFASQRMAVFGPDLREMPPGEFGEIMLAGSQLTRGYWKAPEINAAKFVEVEGVRWYRTGDIGCLVEPTGYVYAGRMDRQVKLHGYRAELQEIETVLRRITARAEIAVAPWPKVSEGSYDGCVGFISGEPIDTATLRKACHVYLPNYMTPERFIFVDQLPLNRNGKIDYKALTDRLDNPAHENTPAG